MNLFRKRGLSDKMNQARVSLFGSGRRLRSERTLIDCLTTLETSIFSYRPPESAYRSAYVFPGWRWHGLQEKPPETVISFNDSNNDFLLAAFWSDRSGTECVLFPLGNGDERLLSLPIIDHWHYRDPSLRSIGVIPGGQIALAPPLVPDQFFDEILKIANFPSTPFNLETLGMEIGKMFLARAHQFIASYDPGSADRFIQSHRYNGGSLQNFCQSILDDLAAWNPDVLPYVQDTPMRVRAIVLELAKAPMWEQLERLSQSPTPLQDRAPIADPDGIHDSPEMWIKTGIAHMQNARYAEALVAYERALVMDPNYIDAWNNKGIVLRNLGRYQEALVVYDHVLTLNPNDVLAWNNKGNVLSNMGRLEEALAHSEQALILAPSNAGCWYCKGCTLADLGRYQEALVAYDHALTLNPNYTDAWSNKGYAFKALGCYQEALITCGRALNLDPNHIDAWNNKGSVLADLECYEEALVAYDRALALNPNDVLAWFNKGNVLYALKQYEKALATYDRVRVLDPNHIDAWNNKGIMLTYLGRYEEALAAYSHVLTLDPNHVNAWNNKGVVLRMLGNLPEAEAAERHARELGG